MVQQTARARYTGARFLVRQRGFSLQRAAYIKQRLDKEAPELASRTKASGLGFRENLVGTGTDDARDALDRRVEFKITGC